MTVLPRFVVKKAAVLGSGVMGSQIAAHLVNANVSVVLFDLPSVEGNPNAIVQKNLAFLQKLEPTPYSSKSKAPFIVAANYGSDLSLLQECDFVIEAISERMDWKKELYAKVVPYLNPNVIFASNTSGLQIKELAKELPEHLQSRFCGVHFFNPPRYMALVEVIAHDKTDASMLNQLEEFLTSTLGKGVIRAKDTPNFIANRIGVFSMLATMYHTQKYQLGFDVVDALTGTSIGRAKSATFRTLDVVGIDTLAHVIQTMKETLPGDPWHGFFESPTWLKDLIQKGSLGQKTGRGIYQKVGKEIHVLDPHSGTYRPADSKGVDPQVSQILALKNPSEKFKALMSCQHPQAQFLWSIFKDLFHYCSYHLKDIAHNARDLDLAVRWGYGWTFGPFETWQGAGWSFLAKQLAQEIAQGQTMSSVSLPSWVLEPSRDGVHAAEGSYAPSLDRLVPRSSLPLYQRQLFPESVLGEVQLFGTTVYENSGVRLWTLDNRVAILSFKSKMNCIGSDVLEGILESVRRAEASFEGLVLWQSKAPFSVGANLMQVTTAIQEGRFEEVKAMIQKFQRASMALKYAMVPTVAAVSGMALGGGCEIAMHCARRVASLESYMGLVEFGVGLLPAGGGCKELVLRAAQDAKGGNLFFFLQKSFEQVAMGRVSKSAEEAREMGYLNSSDTIVFHPQEVLWTAIEQAKSMYASVYRPPLKGIPCIPVAGKGGRATFLAGLVNLMEGGFISQHDYVIGEKIATVFAGGLIEQNTLVTEEWLLQLELDLFMELVQMPKTQERIAHMLKTGKPLRN